MIYTCKPFEMQSIAILPLIGFVWDGAGDVNINKCV